MFCEDGFDIINYYPAEFPYLLPSIFAIWGLCVGSYLNVAIYRLPLGLSTNKPRRSFCPRCKTLIPWYFNIPVLSWLMLRGRSACCQQPIAFRYIAVEILTGLLFGGLCYFYRAEGIATQMLICIWWAIALIIFFIDWEQFIVLPSLCVGASVTGLLIAGCAPWMISHGSEHSALGGIGFSALGIIFAFILMKAIGLLGRAAFGRKTIDFEGQREWSMAPTSDGEDIELIMNGEVHLWSELFLEMSHRLIFKRGSLELEGRGVIEGDIVMTAREIILPDKSRIALEDLDSAKGSCTGWRQMREAMGSGDAWIAMAIGALCGWQGFGVALVAGCFIGIVWAMVARIGRGTPLPFGPCMIGGTLLYVLGFTSWLWERYMALLAAI